MRVFFKNIQYLKVLFRKKTEFKKNKIIQKLVNDNQSFYLQGIKMDFHY